MSAAAQTPGAIPDLRLWLDAADVNGDGSLPPDGSLIGTWSDKSGNAADATETLPTAQPTLQHEAFGCLPGLYFDNLALGLQGQITRPNAQDFTVFMVAEMGLSNNGKRNAFMEMSSAGGSGPRSILFQTHVWPTPLNTPINLDVLQVIRWTEQAPSANFSVYEDGVGNTVNRAKSWGIVGRGTVQYFLGDDRTGGDEMEDGYINEVLVYDRLLSAQEISDVETYLSAKWQNLPACDAASLQIDKTAEPTQANGYALPGEDVTYTFSIRNTGGASMDADSIFLVDTLPAEVEIWTGDFDAGDPGGGPVAFDGGGTGLTFDPLTDVGVSFASTRPADMSSCSDTPNGGYDDRARFLCLAPGGTVAPGPGPSTATLKFRGRIK